MVQNVQASVRIPPVIFTWFEPIYEEQDVCRSAGLSEIPDCYTASGMYDYDGIMDTEMVFKECLEHIEYLPDAVASLQATASWMAPVRPGSQVN